MTSAREMKLVQTEGAVHVSDEENRDKPIRKNMNLYSGYGVDTETESYAWIDLDRTKLLKMDQSSSANLVKNGGRLKIDLEEGSIFFCVTKPLTDGEGLEFETSNMAMSIRGTTGIFRSISEDQSQLVLMEGDVTLADGKSLTTGQVADLVVGDDGVAEVTTRPVTDGDVPQYVLDLIAENEDVRNKILSGGGRVDYVSEEALMAIYGDLIKCYREALKGEEMDYSVTDYTRYLAEINNISAFVASHGVEPAYRPRPGLTGFEAEDPAALRGWQYAFFDINHDGYPELLIADNTLEEGSGIRDIWTTDGQEAKQVNWPANAAQCFKITANGYVAYVDAAEYLITFKDRTCYQIDPTDGWGDCVAHIEEGVPGWTAWTGRVSDDIWGKVLFKTNDEEEFRAYVTENYPLVPDLSLNWRPLS